VTGVADLLGQAEAAVSAAEDLAALDAVRVQFLGKKGLFTAQLREVGKLPPDQIPAAGKAINTAKSALESAIEARRAALEARRIAAQLAAEAIDVTLPGRGEVPGRLHPVTRTLRRMIAILGHAGFDVHTGPEVEDDFHNFTALNIPEDHPARAMHDTFYLRSGLLLRTHTSPVQIRAMREHGAPIRLIAACASAADEHVTARAVGTPASTITDFANALDVSSMAAARVGPTIASLAARKASTTPASSGASGPTSVQSTRSR